MKRLLLFLGALGIMVFLSNISYAQKVVVEVPGFYESGGVAPDNYGTLNDAIDNVIANGDINNTIFHLHSYDVYVLSKSIFIDKGQSLEIVADPPLRAGDADAQTVQNSAPPQIVWTEEAITRDYLIQTYGDLIMKNVWVRFCDFLGSKLQTGITFENDSTKDHERGTFDNCILDYDGIGSEAGGTITVKAAHFVGHFTNCYWRNNSDNHFQYYGRAVSFPYQSSGWHYDSLFFENCTFTNISRIVMMEGNEWGSNVQLNHCTILNTVEWVLQSSWYDHLSVTNSVIVNPYMLGYRALDVCDSTQTYDDFLAGNCNPPGGALFQELGPVDSLGFTVDFTDQDREVFVGNNAYVYTDYMQAWYTDCGWCKDQHKQRLDEELHHPYPMLGANGLAYIDSMDGQGNKVYPKMNIDQSTIYGDDPGFIVPATNQDTMLMFIEYKWSTAADVNWSYEPYAAQIQQWPLPENLAYTNVAYQTAAMGGFPLGDLNWWPDKMAAWQAQRDAEWTTINNWLNYGNPNGGLDVREKPGTLPGSFVLKQNYPNPFNPTTNIEYSIPKQSYVSLKVYNSIGQLVATLFDGQQHPGNYVATFDGTGLASGIYMYQLESEGVSISKKFVLMK